ncbi:MAG: hypothetical protein HC811_09365 [Flammeovirgaceae bacterium]|nr:hypothetical protein [Flammeovirgaceae bacterium]
MIQKFFPLDKNYILEEAQFSIRHSLLHILLDKTKQAYLQRYNPLGIEDALSLRIKKYKPNSLTSLFALYKNMAAIYRYRFGKNQLEFLWDGSDHTIKYQDEWAECFCAWIDVFCENDLFIRAVLDVTVFEIENQKAQLAENRMNNFMLQYFELRIQKKHGIVEVPAA